MVRSRPYKECQPKVRRSEKRIEAGHDAKNDSDLNSEASTFALGASEGLSAGEGAALGSPRHEHEVQRFIAGVKAARFSI